MGDLAVRGNDIGGVLRPGAGGPEQVQDIGGDADPQRAASRVDRENVVGEAHVGDGSADPARRGDG